jgi:hypothetical protein
MVGTITQQGSFVSTGTTKDIQIVSGFDWIYAYNYTKIASGDADTGIAFYWQRGSPNMVGGLPVGYAFEVKTNGDGSAVHMRIADDAFFFEDSTVRPPQGTGFPTPPVAITAISNDDPPIVSCPDTFELFDGAIVSLERVNGAAQLGGILFSVDDVVTDTSFRLPYAPQIAAATTGYFRRIDNDQVYFPRRRFITNVITGKTTRVTVSVRVSTPQRGGLQMRLIIPPACGTISEKLNGVVGNILGVDGTTNSLIFDINSEGFPEFQFPLDGDYPFTEPQLVPIGGGNFEGGRATYVFGTQNQAHYGVQLDPGVDGPAGEAGDVIYWYAGKSVTDQPS